MRLIFCKRLLQKVAAHLFRQHNGCEEAVLDLDDSPLICLLLSFSFCQQPVGQLDSLVDVGSCKWIKHSYIKESTMSTIFPETHGLHIKSYISSIFAMCWNVYLNMGW